MEKTADAVITALAHQLSKKPRNALALTVEPQNAHVSIALADLLAALVKPRHLAAKEINATAAKVTNALAARAEAANAVPHANATRTNALPALTDPTLHVSSSF